MGYSHSSLCNASVPWRSPPDKQEGPCLCSWAARGIVRDELLGYDEGDSVLLGMGEANGPLSETELLGAPGGATAEPD